MKDDLVTALYSDIETEEVFDSEVAIQHSRDGFTHAFAFGFREESNVTHVHTHDGQCSFANDLRRTQNRSVATNRKDHLDLIERDTRFQPLERRKVGRRCGNDLPLCFTQYRHNTATD